MYPSCLGNVRHFKSDFALQSLLKIILSDQSNTSSLWFSLPTFQGSTGLTINEGIPKHHRRCVWDSNPTNGSITRMEWWRLFKHAMFWRCFTRMQNDMLLPKHPGNIKHHREVLRLLSKLHLQHYHLTYCKLPKANHLKKIKSLSIIFCKTHLPCQKAGNNRATHQQRSGLKGETPPISWNKINLRGFLNHILECHHWWPSISPRKISRYFRSSCRKTGIIPTSRCRRPSLSFGRWTGEKLESLLTSWVLNQK